LVRPKISIANKNVSLPKVSQSQLGFRCRSRWGYINWGYNNWQKKSLLNFIIFGQIAAEECLHPSAAPEPRALSHNHINKLPYQVPNLFILSQKILPLAGMRRHRNQS
jgi:hypothetical protein